MNKIFCALFFSLLMTNAMAQVGINNSNPDASAALDIFAIKKGLLPPRMNTANREGIVNPAIGLVVFDKTKESLYVFTSRGWEQLTGASTSAYAQPTDIVGTPNTAGNNFGYSVSIGLGPTKDIAVVGSPGVNNKTGRAETMILHAPSNKWMRGINLYEPQVLAGDQFGYSVAIDRLNAGEDIVVGAPFTQAGATPDAGAVYFFRNNIAFNRVLAPVARQATNAKFGRSVDIAATSDNGGKGFAIVGAPGANSNQGEAYIYEFNPNNSQWEHRATLTDNFGAAADSFGLSVAIHYVASADTGWAFVGAPYDDDAVPDGSNTGSVTAFRKAAGSSLWTRVGKITIGNIVNRWFGFSLAPVFKCGKLLVGAANMEGALYEVSLAALQGNTASFTLKKIPTNPGSPGYPGIPGLGASISAMPVNGNCDEIYLASGFPQGTIDDRNLMNYGYVSILKYDGIKWSSVEDQLVDPVLTEEGTLFGRAVSIHTKSRTIIVGAPWQTINNNAQQGKIQSRVF